MPGGPAPAVFDLRFVVQRGQEEEPELQDGVRPDVNLLERIILTDEPRVTRSVPCLLA